MGEAIPKSLPGRISSYTGHRWLALKSPLNILKYFWFILKRLLQHKPPEPIKKKKKNHKQHTAFPLSRNQYSQRDSSKNQGNTPPQPKIAFNCKFNLLFSKLIWHRCSKQSLPSKDIIKTRPSQENAPGPRHEWNKNMCSESRAKDQTKSQRPMMNSAMVKAVTHRLQILTRSNRDYCFCLLGALQHLLHNSMGYLIQKWLAGLIWLNDRWGRVDLHSPNPESTQLA